MYSKEENGRRPQGRNGNFQQHLALSAAAKVPITKSRAELYDMTTEDGRSTSGVCSLYGQLSQGRMANFPAFIASKSFDL